MINPAAFFKCFFATIYGQETVILHSVKFDNIDELVRNKGEEKYVYNKTFRHRVDWYVFRV